MSHKTTLIILSAIFISLAGLLFSQTAAADGPQAASVDFQHFWLTTSNNTDGATTAVDASGGIHVAFTAHTASGGTTYPVYYAYCASNCAAIAQWSGPIVVGNTGAWGGNARLLLTSTGHPRLMWFNEALVTTNGFYQYAECDSDCTNAGHWTTSENLASMLVDSGPGRYFALDAQDHPRYVYTDTGIDHTGTYYASCDTHCVTAANWQEVQLTSNYLLYDFSMAVAASGRAAIAYRDASSYPDTLGYLQCDANCNQAENWQSATLVDNLGSGYALSLRLDSQGRPRLAYYLGYIASGNANNDLLFYAWCDSGCTQPAHWAGYPVGLQADHGQDVDLALDAQERPHLAYYVDDTANSLNGLGYATCTANCQSASANWQAQMVENSDDLNSSDPVPPVAPCTYSLWLEVGRYPSLALDASNNPRFGYTAIHDQGGPSCTLYEDIRLARFATAGSPATPTAPASVTVSGPGTGVIETSYTFTATVAPITATTPITYVWEASGQTVQTHTGGASDTASFTWAASDTGSKTITVTASNSVGSVVGSRSILITVTPIAFDHSVYLPSVIR